MWIGVIVYAAALNSAVVPPKLFSEYVALYDCEYDLFLFTRKGEELAHPASTTKIGLFLYALEQNLERDRYVHVPKSVLRRLPKAKKIAAHYAVEPYLLEPDAILTGLVPDEAYSVNDLYHAMMLDSSNDAANVVAYHLGGQSIETCVIGINQLLKRIGCSATTFVNPNGLEYPAHRATAIDLTKMFVYGMQNYPDFLDVLGKNHFELHAEKVRDRKINTTNRLMRLENKMFYKYCIGGKTGYTENAGYCLVAAAKNGERTLVATVLRAPGEKERFIDAINLFNTAFMEKKSVRTFYNKEDPCFYFTPTNRSRTIPLALEEELSIETFESRLAVLETRVIFSPLSVPIQKGQVCGYVEIVTPSGKVVAKRPLLAVRGLGHNIWTFFAAHPIAMLIFLCCLFVYGIFWQRIRDLIQTLLEKKAHNQPAI